MLSFPVCVLMPASSPRLAQHLQQASRSLHILTAFKPIHVPSCLANPHCPRYQPLPTIPMAQLGQPRPARPASMSADAAAAGAPTATTPQAAASARKATQGDLVQKALFASPVPLVDIGANLVDKSFASVSATAGRGGGHERVPPCSVGALLGAASWQACMD